MEKREERKERNGAKEEPKEPTEILEEVVQAKYPILLAKDTIIKKK